jgi:hypothetical protein
MVQVLGNTCLTGPGLSTASLAGCLLVVMRCDCIMNRLCYCTCALNDAVQQQSLMYIVIHA